jgi:hypothetical protein
LNWTTPCRNDTLFYYYFDKPCTCGLSHQSSSCRYIEIYIFKTTWERSSAQWQKFALVSLVCLFVFLTACWRSSSRSQIENYLFRTAWERSSSWWQKFAWFSLVCLCVLLVLKLKTGEGVFIEVLGCCGPHKLLVQCGSHKRIICWGIPDFVFRNTLTPWVNPDFIIRKTYLWLFYQLNEHLCRKLKHIESLNNIYIIQNIINNLIQQHITNTQLKQHKTRD